MMASKRLNQINCGCAMYKYFHLMSFSLNFHICEITRTIAASPIAAKFL